MKYKIVVFDLDGTILNTLEDLADSTNYALSVFDMPERTIEEIRHFVGNGIRKLMERAVPQGTPESMIVKVHETFTEHYKNHCADKTRPYDGIKELIENIKKCRCVHCGCI
ncbi:MAG: HAD hydrolase-like protein [Lachnospira eligens]